MWGVGRRGDKEVLEWRRIVLSVTETGGLFMLAVELMQLFSESKM